MSGIVFSSHDGFGLGHVRRNAKIAAAVRKMDRRVPIALVTGVAGQFAWLDRGDVAVVRVPPIVKGPDSRYVATGMTLDEAIARRARAFAETVRRLDPDVVVVDRHPFGIFGELREGLDHARRSGARILLGLRDVLDGPATVAEEIGGARWAGAAGLYDEALVYGERHLCDHEVEYALPIHARYCGWVIDEAAPARREPRLLAIAAGGGGDGDAIRHLGTEILRLQPRWTGILAAGPFSDVEIRAQAGSRSLDGRLAIVSGAEGGAPLFARAAGVLQMAGYNSTYEALAAGLRPIFLPRRAPRQEQVIRATRLAALGLADVVPEEASPSEVAPLLDGRRTLGGDDLSRAGVALDGASRAASHLLDLAHRRRPVVARAVFGPSFRPARTTLTNRPGPDLGRTTAVGQR